MILLTYLPMTDQPAWTDKDLQSSPHDAADKARRVEQMFAAIAESYDINNRVHSLWRDQAWRRKTVKLANLKPGQIVVDVACGTGDLSQAFLQAGAGRVIGIDFTENMLRVAEHKKQALQLTQQTTCETLTPTSPPLSISAAASSSATPATSFADKLTYHVGDAMALPLADNCADILTIAFGIRNVAIPQKAITEFYRVLKPGGRLCILEFSLPRNPVLRAFYNFYFKHIMPRTAALIARDRSGAYKYLPKSVNTFIRRDQMLDMISAAGFHSPTPVPMTFGIAVCYHATKPK